MNNKRLFTLLAISLMIATIFLPRNSLLIAENQGATLVTRTPSPVPGGGGGGNQPPPATATYTPTPQPSPTSTLIPVTIAATPEGGFIPTAVFCSENPTVQATNTTNVRPGPGIEYGDPIDTLVFLEVRFIVGRAADTPWWLIALNNGGTGWVADNVVNVSGNVNIVPIANPPLLDGATATPGTPWTPAGSADCPLPPTSTATPTPNLTATANAAQALSTETPTNTPEPTATETAETESAASPTLSAPTPVAVAAVPTVVPPTAVPLETETATRSGSSSFLLLAAGLLAGAAAIFAWQQRRKDKAAP